MRRAGGVLGGWWGSPRTAGIRRPRPVLPTPLLRPLDHASRALRILASFHAPAYSRRARRNRGGPRPATAVRAGRRGREPGRAPRAGRAPGSGQQIGVLGRTQAAARGLGGAAAGAVVDDGGAGPGGGLDEVVEEQLEVERQAPLGCVVEAGAVREPAIPVDQDQRESDDSPSSRAVAASASGPQAACALAGWRPSARASRRSSRTCRAGSSPAPRSGECPRGRAAPSRSGRPHRARHGVRRRSGGDGGR